MALRVVVLVIAVLSLAVAGWASVRAGGSVAPSPEAPVTVGSVRVAAGDLEAAAARSAGARPGRLAAARRAAADRAIERLWLQGEATARGLRPAAELGALRAQVADALVGAGPAPGGARLAAAFDAFHERWRARTRCLAAYRDVYEDRCGDGAGAATGTCRWMGEATVCAVRGAVRRRWLVVRDTPSARATRAAVARLPRRLALRLRGARAGVVRLRSRTAALTIARAVYLVARAARARAAAAARAAAKRAAAARAHAAERARLARERQERVRDPRLAGQALAAARDACERQLHDSDPYLFGFGMQDVVGQAQGLIAARVALMRRLRASARDTIDRRKLQPLVDGIAAGNRELVRLAAADPATIAARAARFDARTEPERAISRRLGLGDCLARPGR